MFVTSTEDRARSVTTRGCWLSEGDCNSVFLTQLSFFPKPIAMVLIVKPPPHPCLPGKVVPKKPGLVVRGPSSSGDTMPVVASGASSSSVTTLVVGPQQPKAPQQAKASAPLTGALFLGPPPPPPRPSMMPHQGEMPHISVPVPKCCQGRNWKVQVVRRGGAVEKHDIHQGLGPFPRDD